MEIKRKKYGIYLFSAYLCSVWASWSVSCTGCYIHYKNTKRYPKVFTWIALVAFSLICIYLLIVKQEWNLSFLLMCIAVAVGNVLDTKSR